MLRIIATVAMLLLAGCSRQFTSSSGSATIPGKAIEAYSKATGLPPQQARQAMINDNLTSRGASLPKQALER